MEQENDPSAFIQIRNLARIYKKGKLETHALRGVSFNIAKGEFISIVGKSGSGKSTLLNLIGGLDTASSGSIVFDKSNLTDMKRAELALHRRFSVGMIFQSFNLINSRSALENVTLALTFGGVSRRDRKDKARTLLSKVGLQHRLHHKPGELSGGEAQRVAIARALANNPQVLLADEPTGNLDTETSEDIIGLIKKVNHDEHKTVIMITHDLETAIKVSHRIIRLKDGQIIEEIRKESEV